MKKKILTTIAIAICAIALVIGSIAGTVAYLSVRVSVTNTFTHGEVTITMDERRVNKDGTPASDSLTDRNSGNEYMLMPGTTFTKDPIIHIDPKSQEMYLFLKVDNGIAGLAMTDEDKAVINAKRVAEGKEPVSTIHEQLIANGWKVYVDNQDDDDSANDVTYQNRITTPIEGGYSLVSTSTVYYLSKGAGESDTDAKVVGPDIKFGNMATGDIPTIDYFTVGLAGATQTTMSAYVRKDATIVITAYAVQGVGDSINSLNSAADVFKSEFESAIDTSN